MMSPVLLRPATAEEAVEVFIDAFAGYPVHIWARAWRATC